MILNCTGCINVTVLTGTTLAVDPRGNVVFILFCAVNQTHSCCFNRHSTPTLWPESFVSLVSRTDLFPTNYLQNQFPSLVWITHSEVCHHWPVMTQYMSSETAKQHLSQDLNSVSWPWASSLCAPEHLWKNLLPEATTSPRITAYKLCTFPTKCKTNPEIHSDTNIKAPMQPASTGCPGAAEDKTIKNRWQILGHSHLKPKYCQTGFLSSFCQLNQQAHPNSPGSCAMLMNYGGVQHYIKCDILKKRTHKENKQTWEPIVVPMQIKNTNKPNNLMRFKF